MFQIKQNDSLLGKKYNNFIEKLIKKLNLFKKILEH